VIGTRVAALYDIHGNLPALEAVLADVVPADVDAVVIGGDIVPGPMPRECLARLRQVRVPVHGLQGNGEREVLAHRRGVLGSTVPEQAREALRWTAEQLSPEDERLLAGWPATLRLSIREFGDVLFCHATPRNDTDVFTRLTPEDQLRPIFADLPETLVVCGHTHMQFDRLVARTRIVNAGSVGMPFGPPGAYWLLLGPGLELRCTTYDLLHAARRVRATGYPQAQAFAAQNILRPPAEAAMLQAFANVALR